MSYTESSSDEAHSLERTPRGTYPTRVEDTEYSSPSSSDPEELSLRYKRDEVTAQPSGAKQKNKYVSSLSSHQEEPVKKQPSSWIRHVEAPEAPPALPGYYHESSKHAVRDRHDREDGSFEEAARPMQRRPFNDMRGKKQTERFSHGQPCSPHQSRQESARSQSRPGDRDSLSPSQPQAAPYGRDRARGSRYRSELDPANFTMGNFRGTRDSDYAGRHKHQSQQRSPSRPSRSDNRCKLEPETRSGRSTVPISPEQHPRIVFGYRGNRNGSNSWHQLHRDPDYKPGTRIADRNMYDEKSSTPVHSPSHDDDGYANRAHEAPHAHVPQSHARDKRPPPFNHGGGVRRPAQRNSSELSGRSSGARGLEHQMDAPRDERMTNYTRGPTTAGLDVTNSWKRDLNNRMKRAKYHMAMQEGHMRGSGNSARR